MIDHTAHRLATDWQQYEGPRGGTGWQDSSNPSDIRYQVDKPEDGEPSEENGSPGDYFIPDVPLYHGTQALDKIKEEGFEVSTSGGGQRGLKGVWISMNAEDPDRYARAIRENPQEAVVATVKINPDMRIANLIEAEQSHKDATVGLLKFVGVDVDGPKDAPALQRFRELQPFAMTVLLQEKGYDGAVIPNTLEKGGQPEIVIFDPENVGIEEDSKVEQWSAKKFKNPKHAKAFMKWFGDSKVVDDNGEPIMVFHGTASEQPFDKFNTPAYFTSSPGESDMYSIGQIELVNRWRGERIKNSDIPVQTTEMLRAGNDSSMQDIREHVTEGDVGKVFNDGTNLFLIREYNKDSDFVKLALVEDALIDGWYTEDGPRVTVGPLPKQPARTYATYLRIENPYRLDASETALLSDSHKTVSQAAKERAKELMSQGYDGIITDSDFGAGMVYIPFDPTQIKSSANRGTWGKDDPRISMAIQPGTRKTENGVEYVLRDSRWHRADEGKSGSGGGGAAEQVGQKRAKHGEIGPNGEWYNGGAFIATTEMPKRQRDKLKKLASSKVKIGPYEWVIPDPGKISIFDRLVGVEMGPDGNVNFNYLKIQSFSADYIEATKELAEKYKAGEKWVDATDYPDFVNFKHVAEMLDAGEAIPGNIMSAVPDEWKERLGIERWEVGKDDPHILMAIQPGTRKTEDGVEYVLKDSRWHRADEGKSGSGEASSVGDYEDALALPDGFSDYWKADWYNAGFIAPDGTLLGMVGRHRKMMKALGATGSPGHDGNTPEIAGKYGLVRIGDSSRVSGGKVLRSIHAEVFGIPTHDQLRMISDRAEDAESVWIDASDLSGNSIANKTWTVRPPSPGQIMAFVKATYLSKDSPNISMAIQPGTRKTENGREYVLKDSRWHRVKDGNGKPVQEAKATDDVKLAAYLRYDKSDITPYYLTDRDEQRDSRRDLMRIIRHSRDPEDMETFRRLAEEEWRYEKTKSVIFKEWFGDWEKGEGSKVVNDEGEPQETASYSAVVDEDGDPIAVYHGTTHDFDEFDTERANPESDMGSGHYFTEDIGDAEINYGRVGPDLQSRIGILTDRIFDEVYDFLDDFEDKLIGTGIESLSPSLRGMAGEIPLSNTQIATIRRLAYEVIKDNYYLFQGAPADDIQEILTDYATKPEDTYDEFDIAKKIATERLSGDKPRLMKTYLNIRKPIVLGDPWRGKKGTSRRGAEGETQFDVQWVEEDDNGLRTDDPDFDPDKFDYDSAQVVEVKGTGHDLIEEVKRVASSYYGVGDYADLDELSMSIMEWDNMPAGELVGRLKQTESIMYATDDNGRLMGGDLISQALRNIGFDGVIYQDASRHFPGMSMPEGTRHFISWDSRNIKSVKNRGTFDSRSRHVRMAIDWKPYEGPRGGAGWQDPSNPTDIRYQVEKPGEDEGPEQDQYSKTEFDVRDIPTVDEFNSHLKENADKWFLGEESIERNTRKYDWSGVGEKLELLDASEFPMEIDTSPVDLTMAGTKETEQARLLPDKDQMQKFKYSSIKGEFSIDDGDTLFVRHQTTSKWEDEFMRLGIDTRSPPPDHRLGRLTLNEDGQWVQSRIRDPGLYVEPNFGLGYGVIIQVKAGQIKASVESEGLGHGGGLAGLYGSKDAVISGEVIPPENIVGVHSWDFETQSPVWIPNPRNPHSNRLEIRDRELSLIEAKEEDKAPVLHSTKDEIPDKELERKTDAAIESFVPNVEGAVVTRKKFYSYFTITTPDGSELLGYGGNSDMPGERNRGNQGEIFIIKSKTPRQGMGTALAKDAIRLMKDIGAEFVVMRSPNEGGVALNRKLVREGIIGEAIIPEPNEFNVHTSTSIHKIITDSVSLALQPGTRKIKDGREYVLKDSRWHRIDDEEDKRSVGRTEGSLIYDNPVADARVEDRNIESDVYNQMAMLAERPVSSITPEERVKLNRLPKGSGFREVAEVLGYEFPPDGEAERRIEEKLQLIFEPAKVGVRVPSKYLDKILKDGRLKTQFETKTSRGDYDPDARARVENEIFGIHVRTRGGRPIYGYVYDDLSNDKYNYKDDSYNKTVSNYGDLTFVMKPDARDRTTFSGGDTLFEWDSEFRKARARRHGEDSNERRYAPVAMNDPNNKRFGIDMHQNSSLLTDGVKSIDDLPVQNSAIEAHIHGGVKLEDVAKVVMHFDQGAFETFEFDRVDELAKLGVEFEIIVPDRSSHYYNRDSGLESNFPSDWKEWLEEEYPDVKLTGYESKKRVYPPGRRSRPKAAKREAIKGTIGEPRPAGVAPKRMAWTPYEGPRGGKGWKSAETGNVAYQIEKPGENRNSAEGEVSPGARVMHNGMMYKVDSLRHVTGDIYNVSAHRIKPSTGSTFGEEKNWPIKRTSAGNPKVTEWASKRFKNPEHAKAFVKWFGESKYVDENGHPLVYYHGTTGLDYSRAKDGKDGKEDQEDLQFDIFRSPDTEYDTSSLNERIGTHFAESADVAGSFTSFNAGKTAADHGRIFPVFISVKNPKVINNNGRFDDHAQNVDILDTVIPRRKDLFVEWIMKSRNITESMGGEIFDLLKAGKDIPRERWSVAEFTFDPERTHSGNHIGDYIASYDSGLIMLREKRQEVVDEYKRILKSQGYDGIEYENTAPMEIGGVQEEHRTAVVPLDRGQVKSSSGNIGTYDRSKDRFRMALQPGSRKTVRGVEYVLQDSRWHRADEIQTGGQPASGKAFHEMNKAEFAALPPPKLMGNDTLYINKVEVIQNPTNTEQYDLIREVKREFPRMRPGEIKVRTTKDANGNRWIWKSHSATHSMIEPFIEELIGREVSQGTEPLTHEEVIREAIRSGVSIPKHIQLEYPHWSKYFSTSDKSQFSAEEEKNWPIKRTSAGNPKVADWASKKFKNPDHASAFLNWFGDSDVVDDNGEPFVLYTGTTQYFDDEFDTTRGNIGTHFGTSDVANHFASKRQGTRGGRIYPVYLSIKKPFRMVDKGDWVDLDIANRLVSDGTMTPLEKDEWKSGFDKRWKDHDFAKGGYDRQSESRALLLRYGYDGVVYINRREGVDLPEDLKHNTAKLNALTDEEFLQRVPNATTSYIAINPTQIKSAIGNLGTFDPDDHRISMAIQPGTRKTEDGVEYVLQDHRWHRADEETTNGKASGMSPELDILSTEIAQSIFDKHRGKKGKGISPYIESLKVMDHDYRVDVMVSMRQKLDGLMDDWAQGELEGHQESIRWGSAHVLRRRLVDEVKDSEAAGFVDRSQATLFSKAVDKVTASMTPWQSSMVSTRLKIFRSFGSESELKDYIEDFTKWDLPDNEKIAGCYLHTKDGEVSTIVADGVEDFLQGPEEMKTLSGLIAHELAHVLDAAHGRISEREEWDRVFKTVIDTPTESLSKYARQSKAEAFAEYARLVFVDPLKAIRYFPSAWEVYKKFVDPRAAREAGLVKELMENM